MALCLALLCSYYSNAQVDSTTGNLVNFTGSPTSTTGNWVNGVYVNQICFQAGQPGNCGPNPSIRAESGSINFSYGTTNLNQVVNINNALAAAGTGIQLSGFNFGFRAKNGNGWDDGRQDYLSAYVKVYDSAGKVVENYDYTQYTNRQYNWSDFNFTETFNKPYNTNKLGAAQFGFIGRDNNFWAGNYGPEIMNVSFSLNYRVDPCAANPASSPTCPGFSNLIKSTNVVVPSTTTNSTTNDITSTPVVNIGGAQLSTTGTISAPDNIPQSLKDIQTITQQSQLQNQQTNSNTQQKNAVSKSLVANIINQIQTSEKAIQTAAVRNANQVFTTSSSRSQEEANAIVENANNGMASQTVISNIGFSNTTTKSNSSTNDILPQQTFNNTVSFQQQFKIEQNNIALESQTTNVTGSTKSGSAIEVTQSKVQVENASVEQKTETVKKDVQPNDLAGKMDIDAIAIVPAEFASYSVVAIVDIPFYKAELIYKNQKTVDNAKALRLLSSDRLHQEMVDQQYRR